MERSKVLEAPAAAADEKAPPVNAPVPPSRPLDHYWQVFERMVIGVVTQLTLPGQSGPDPRTVRLMRHAFFAGARAAFASTMEAFAEIEADDVNGEVRLAAIEREVEAYFRDAIAASFIGRSQT